MARTPEEKKAIAREFNAQFHGRSGQKAIQAALNGREHEIPQHARRGPGTPHYLADESWLRAARRSSQGQREIPQIIRDSRAAWENRRAVADRLSNSAALSLIVADANVVLPGIAVPGLPTCQEIIGLIQTGRINLAVTGPIIREINHVARLPDVDVRLDGDRLAALNHLLSQVAINVSHLLEKESPEMVIADLSDTRYVDALLAAKAEFLVSRDAHLLDFEPVNQDNLPIISPRKFIDIIHRRL